MLKSPADSSDRANAAQRRGDLTLQTPDSGRDLGHSGGDADGIHLGEDGDNLSLGAVDGGAQGVGYPVDELGGRGIAAVRRSATSGGDTC